MELDRGGGGEDLERYGEGKPWSEHIVWILNKKI